MLGVIKVYAQGREVEAYAWASYLGVPMPDWLAERVVRRDGDKLIVRARPGGDELVVKMMEIVTFDRKSGVIGALRPSAFDRRYTATAG